MNGFTTGWTWIDLAILAAAAYLAIMGLVRLMRLRKQQVLEQLRGDARLEQRKRRHAEMVEEQSAEAERAAKQVKKMVRDAAGKNG